MQRLTEALHQYWGYSSFRPLQREAMQSVLADRDSLVVLPTGGGKSLCFQAPAIVKGGMAVVVSPLISLMKDQVDALEANGVPAAKIDSAMNDGDRERVHRAVQERALRLLYVSPERLAQPRFVEYLQRVGVSFFVVDEAHCISHWGHDFRPEYRQLRQLRETFPDTAIHAYTATATERVREDICRELCLRTPSVLVGSFDRPNLTYRVERRSGNGSAKVLDIVRDHPGDSGIVYCMRRADVDTLCEWLKAQGFKALPYHAGMDDGSRKRNQDAFAKEQVDIIVATVAFGMGIDKSNVRYVIHSAMPKSLEHYQQEAGRAGRDGVQADCWLLYSYADFRSWQGILEKSEMEPSARAVAVQKLEDMFHFCDRAQCRHKALVTYFGQTFKDAPCDACDRCLGSEGGMEDAAEIAGNILRCVTELGTMAGPSYTTLVLSGSREDRVLAKGHHKIASFGVLSSCTARAIRDWVEELARQGCLEKYGEYSVLRLTEKGILVQQGAHVPSLTRPEAAPKRAARTSRATADLTPLAPLDRALFDLLRALRKDKAEELGVPPFVVFSDAALRDMARRKPANRAAFLQVSGVGQRKSEAFGDEFVGAIAAYCAEHPDARPALETPAESMPPRLRGRTAKKETAMRQAIALLDAGHSIESVAESMDLSTSTIASYLAEHIQERGTTDYSAWITDGEASRIADAARETGVERMGPILERLGGEVSDAKIRIWMACMNNLPFQEGV